MTAYPAERIGLPGVGRITEGEPADLVLFDPEAIADNTAPGRSDERPTGIHTVLVSGHVMAQGGRIVSRERPGRVLRK